MYDSDFIENKNASVGINPQGGYVTSWKIGNENILYIGSSIRRTGIPILFPYFGKSNTSRMHGFARDSLWKIVQKTSGSVTMAITNEDITPDDQKEYPYKFVTEIKLELMDENILKYTLNVANNDVSDLPISPGLHPYWSVPHELKKSIKTNLNNFYPAKVDWDNSPPDDPVEYSSPAEINLNDKTIIIEDISSETKVKYIQVWSQTPIRDPDYNFICIEPICGLNYGINQEPIIVPAGKTWNMTILFTCLNIRKYYT